MALVGQHVMAHGETHRHIVPLSLQIVMAIALAARRVVQVIVVVVIKRANAYKSIAVNFAQPKPCTLGSVRLTASVAVAPTRMPFQVMPTADEKTVKSVQI